MTSLRDRYHALPRAARWLIFAGLFMALYFAAIEPALKWTDRLSTSADAVAASLARERQLAAAWSDSNTPAAAAKAAFGSPALPGPTEPRARALYTRVNKIFEAHGIVPDIGERRSPLRADGTERVSGPAHRIDRFILDLTFEASPEVAAAVLAELEKAEEVAAVGRVQLRRLDTSRTPGGPSADAAPPRVRAILSPEAWVLVEGTQQ